MLKDIMGVIITQPTILDGRVDKCGKLIQTVRGVGPLVALDITRSLQLLGYLNLIDAFGQKRSNCCNVSRHDLSIIQFYLFSIHLKPIHIKMRRWLSH